MSLWQDFMTNDDKVIHKWAHYFPVYEKHFSRWKNQSLVFWEVGVYGGGSLQMWQRYFGPNAIIIGLDINNRCKEHESPGIHVRIGDQADTKFLASVIEEFGPPDVLLDDASHHMDPTWKLFEFVYPQMPKNSVYMVEDMHTSYWPRWGGGVDVETSFINRSKKLIDELNADHSKGVIEPTEFTRTTASISFYDSIVAFEKGNIWWKSGFRTGAEELVKSIDEPRRSRAAAKPAGEGATPDNADASSGGKGSTDGFNGND